MTTPGQRPPERPAGRPRQYEWVAGEMGRTVARMDDFEVVEERRRVMAALASLTEQYRALNQAMSTREALKWMVGNG
jgi:hypothetical protein